jgi:predicted cupin superfamily sugar epimerase
MTATHIHGFRKVKTDEYEFAKFLRKENSISNWRKVDKANMWRNPSGKVVAVCYYSGDGGMDVSYWIADDLKYPA